MRYTCWRSFAISQFFFGLWTKCFQPGIWNFFLVSGGKISQETHFIKKMNHFRTFASNFETVIKIFWLGCQNRSLGVQRNIFQEKLCFWKHLIGFQFPTLSGRLLAFPTAGCPKLHSIFQRNFSRKINCNEKKIVFLQPFPDLSEELSDSWRQLFSRVAKTALWKPKEGSVEKNVMKNIIQLCIFFGIQSSFFRAFDGVVGIATYVCREIFWRKKSSNRNSGFLSFFHFEQKNCGLLVKSFGHVLQDCT